MSGRDWFDFTAANKGMGMRMLMERTGISKEEAAAFGDNFNDETMLDSVGPSVFDAACQSGVA